MGRIPGALPLFEGEYEHSAGIVEATLAMGAARYPISAIYLHLVAVMDYMSLK